MSAARGKDAGCRGQALKTPANDARRPRGVEKAVPPGPAALRGLQACIALSPCAGLMSPAAGGANELFVE